MSIEPQIQEQLARVARRQAQLRAWRRLAICWAASAAVALLLLAIERQSGLASSLTLPVVGVLGVAGALFAWLKGSQQTDWRQTARLIEARHPELEGRLVTAIQQQPAGNGQLNYLQQRLVLETLEYCRRSDWVDLIPKSDLNLAKTAHWLALSLFVLALVGLLDTGGHQLLTRTYSTGLEVTPGDVAVERGSSLVIMAKFKGTLPAKVQLAFGQAGALQRIALVKSLGDPLFGGSIPEVNSNFIYSVEYAGKRTRDFQVTVFEHPRLERSDATVSFPEYTALPAKRIENTRRVSAVEGARLDLALRFNKPVQGASLVARDKEHTVIPLTVTTNEPAASLGQFLFESSKSYDLRLVDAEGRTNKVPAEFVFEVLKNRTPEIRLTSPAGDVRPSPLEEIRFEGTVWDDFGIKAFGLAYALNGQNPKFIELGKDIPGNEKKTFQHVLRLEEVEVRPDELVSWFVWADDLGPDGQMRRTMGDLFFGEVRPFEEVFRQGQGMDGQGPGADGESGADRTGRLTDLQKQIVNATWRLERDKGNSAGHTNRTQKSSPQPQRKSESSGNQTSRAVLSNQSRRSVPSLKMAALWQRVSSQHFVGAQSVPGNDSDETDPNKGLGSKSRSGAASPVYEDDAGVVAESQAQALEEAKQVLRRQQDPQAAALWQKAIDDMEAALARLEAARKSPANLKDALAAEQAAYQALIKLQEHEYQVNRARNRNQNSSSRNQQMQQQLEELELKDSENRYEKQREAQRAQNPERREQLQIMSRLQELARRQQDLNERLKELQTALQEARTEKEKAEIQRQLKRLQEEEQQMLADVDELRQRMDKPENQSRMAEERRLLDQTRQEIQKAGEAAGQGATSQALASGTRAQSQLQQMREDMRKKNSSQFAEDLRQLRSQARELAHQQQDILDKIQKDQSGQKKSLSSGADQEQTLEKIKRQKQLMTNLVDHATEISQQAEQAEPLVSQQLYDAIRKFTQNSAKDLKEEQNDLLKNGPMTRSLFDLLRDNSEQGAPKLEELTSELLKQGYLPQASRVGERGRAGLEELKKGVERAAEKVLGDDADELRLAERQLDDLARQLQNEMSDAQGPGSTNGTSAANTGERPGGQRGSAQAANTQPENADANAQARGSQANRSSEQARGQRGNAPGESNSQAQAEPGAQPNDSNQSGLPGGQPGSGRPSRGTAQANAPGNQANASGNPANPPRNQANAPGNPGAGGGDPINDANLASGAGADRNWDWTQLRGESLKRENAPITGEGFTSWSDQLREVEELVDQADMRDDLAKARERARLARQEFKKDRKKPDWAVLQLQVMKPLTEVRDRIADELARRDSREALVPLDRDPVPNRYSDLVRRYYEELGKQK